MMQRIAVACVVSCLAQGALAMTFYVDSAKEGGAETGLSWADACGTIVEGRNVLAATNAMVAGGHTLLVTNSGSTYAENVSLGASVAGTGDGNRNTFRGLGHPEINGSSSYSVNINGGQYCTIDGFNVVADTYAGFYIREDDVIVRNCAVYDDNPDKYGFDLSGVSRLRIENCTLYGLESGIRVYTTGAEPCSIKNSIIASCGRGIYERAGFGSVSNCIFYGNGMHWGYRFTEDQLNADADAGNNMIAHPGFRMGQSYYFDRFYTNNVSATNADHGGYVGAYSDPDITYFDTSDTNYYVDAVDGDDDAGTGTSGNPWLTISKAQANCAAGDTVIVRPGRYAEQVSFYRGGSHDAVTDSELPLTFRAEEIGCATVWSSWAIFNLDRAMGIVLDGFVLDGEGNGRYGVYARASAGCTFNNLTISNLSVSTACAFYFTGGGHVITNANIGPNSGDGFNLINGGMTILDSRIHGNVYGIDSLGPHYTFAERTQFYDNHTGVWNDGRYTYPSGNYARYINCAFYGNSSAGVRSECPQNVRRHYLYLMNCVVYDNTYGAYCDNYGFIFAYNTIFANNSSYGAFEENNDSDGDFRAWNNCWKNNGVNFRSENSTDYDDPADIDTYAAGYSNIVAKPWFMDAPNGNFQISVFSSCADAGRPLAAVTNDFYRNPRPQRDGWDIGLHEAGPLPKGAIFLLY